MAMIGCHNASPKKCQRDIVVRKMKEKKTIALPVQISFDCLLAKSSASEGDLVIAADPLTLIIKIKRYKKEGFTVKLSIQYQGLCS